MPDVTLMPVSGDPWNGGAQPIDPTVAPSTTLSLAAPVGSTPVPQLTASNPAAFDHMVPGGPPQMSAPGSQPSPNAMLATAMANPGGQPLPIQGAPSAGWRAKAMPPFADEFGRALGTDEANTEIQKSDILVAALDGFANAIPFTDRLTAGLAAAVPGSGYFGDYGKALDALHAEEGAAMSAHPIAAFGGGAAGVVALPLPPVGWIGKGAAAAAKVAAEAKALETGVAVTRDTTPFWIEAARGGTVGAGIGAAQGASSSSDLTNLRETAGEAASGAVIGGSFGLLSPAIAHAKYDPNTLYTFIGPGAVGVGMAAGRAEQMLRAGHNPLAVLHRTGWFRGAEGKMRTEVADNMARLHPDALLPSMNNSKLSDVYFHPSLYHFYPDLANLPYSNIPINDLERAHGGMYTHGIGLEKYRIFINPANANLEKALEMMVHEVQHAVQMKEGFALGTNTKYLAPKILPENVMGDLKWMSLLLRNYTDPMNIAREFTLTRGRAPHPTALQEVQHLTPDQIDQLPKNASEAYWRARGEVEARNAARRLAMTRNERMERPPWTTEDIPREQQLTEEGRIPSQPSMLPSGPLAVDGAGAHPPVLPADELKATAPELAAPIQKRANNDPRLKGILHPDSIGLQVGLSISRAYLGPHGAETDGAASDNRAWPFGLRGPFVPDDLLPSLLGHTAHQHDAERAVLPRTRSAAAPNASPQPLALAASVDLDHSGVRETLHHVRTLKAELASLGTASVSVRHSGFGSRGDHAPGAVRTALNGNFGSDGRALG